MDLDAIMSGALDRLADHGQAWAATWTTAAIRAYVLRQVLP